MTKMVPLQSWSGGDHFRQIIKFNENGPLRILINNHGLCKSMLCFCYKKSGRHYSTERNRPDYVLVGEFGLGMEGRMFF